MEEERSIASRCRSHDQQLRAKGRTSAAKDKDCEPETFSGRSDCKHDVSQLKKQCATSTSCQSLDTRPLLPPRPVKHTDSPKIVCSLSAKHAASLPCSSVQPGHSPSAKSRLKSIVTPPLSSNSHSLATKSAKERLVKPQTPPKPHIEFIQEKRISHLHEAEMQDVTGDPPDENDTLSEALGMDRFLDSPDMQPRKPRKQNCSRNKKKSDDYEAEMKSFVQTCEMICRIVQSLHSKYGECIVSETQLQIIKQTLIVLKEKDVCISIFGQHNCGKSTFSNALIGEDVLPVHLMSETSVKVRIQHSRDIHTGVCPQNCPQRLQKICPRLVVQKGSDSRTEITGPHSIYSFLKQKNKEFRRSLSKETLGDCFTMTLKVNIPLLCGSVPPGWRVSIIDNPGFGEAKEQITQLAEASMVTSSAYIYLLQSENIGGREAADFFKQLQSMDKSAIADGRLTIGITKFDTVYESSKKKKDTASPEMVVERVRESIEDATGALVSDDMIIPLCGDWALAGSKLASSLISDPNRDKSERYEVAAEALQKFPQLDIPGGQGQSFIDAVTKLYPPEDLVEKIENISGISQLKARISYVVGKACVKVWATKIHAQLQNCVYGVKKTIKETGTKKERTYRKGCEVLTNDRALYKEIRRTQEAIKATIIRGKDRTASALWKSFELHYENDLKKSKPQNIGKEQARTLIIGFRESCKRKIEKRQLGPREFEIGLKEFLEDSEAKLQTVFDSACGFWNIHGFLLKQIECRINDIASMKVTAGKLFNTTVDPSSTGSDQDDDVEQSSRYKSCIMTPPNLGDIKLKIEIPEVSLPWWKKVVRFFRELLGQTDSCGGDGACPSATRRSSASASVNFDTETSDIYDETWLESTIKVDDHRSSGANEMTEKKSSNLYKYWTHELEETVQKVETYMKEACDQYFKDVKPRAVKYFYREYCLKTRGYLEEFDDDFEEQLRRENERQKKLRKEIENMTKDLKELKKAKDKLSGLEKQLCDAYANFTIEHARHTERESQLRQQRSCHENFELARKEVEKLSTEAGICTELESF